MVKPSATLILLSFTQDLIVDEGGAVNFESRNYFGALWCKCSRRSGNYLIRDVAISVGYTNPLYYFSRVFKNKFGVLHRNMHNK